MRLSANDEQLAMDYTIYMMVGSFFGKAVPGSKWTEQMLRQRYLLLSEATQYSIEEECEMYFENEIAPLLPDDFLKGAVTVRWIPARDRKFTALRFSDGKRQLWISSLYGGRYRKPQFVYWTEGLKLKSDALVEEERIPRPHRARKAG